MVLHVVGGTYDEICIDPPWHELYGSGLRAVYALSGKGTKIIFHTIIGEHDYDSLVCIINSLGAKLEASKIDFTSSFEYDFPLAEPKFFFPEVQIDPIIIKADLVMQFGMIEGNPIVHSRRSIYDPQSPGDPRSFWANGSTTEELIWISNYQEVSRFTDSLNWNDIKNHLFNSEKIEAAIIKKGSDGAILVQKNKEDLHIPVFKTKSVWPIGTGDIFTSSFAYYYFVKEFPIEIAAVKASLATAYYAETIILPLPLDDLKEENFQKFSKVCQTKKKVYLAGPFFTMPQRWMIEQVKKQLTNFGLNVFSPYHEIGLGTPDEVVGLDLEAIQDSDVVVALIDGNDSGTLFEIGYAKALDIPVIIFSENEKEESLTMMKGTNCKIENDFSSLIYKTVWEAYNE